MKAKFSLLLALLLGIWSSGPVVFADDLRHESIAQLAWEFAKDDAIIIAQIGPQGANNAEENKRFKKFTTETLSLIAAQPQNYGAIYQHILKLDHLTTDEIPAFFPTWFDELLNRAFPRKDQLLFLDPAFSPEGVRWMQNVNRLNRALAEILVTYSNEDADRAPKTLFQQTLDYLLTPENLRATNLLAVSKVHLALAMIRLTSDQTQRSYIPLLRELAWTHPYRNIRLMVVNHMLHHLRDYDRTLENLFQSYKWQKEFWFDFEEVPDYVFDIISYYLVLNSFKNPTINARISRLLWQFFWPGLLAPFWLPPENIAPADLYGGLYAVLTKTFLEEQAGQHLAAAKKGKRSRKAEKEQGKGLESSEENLKFSESETSEPAETDRILRIEEIMETEPAKIIEITSSPRWKNHLAVLKTMQTKNISHWHLPTDIITPLYKISMQTTVTSTYPAYQDALELFNLSLRDLLRQRNVTQIQGRIVQTLHFILLNHPGWMQFCQEHQISLAANLPLETLDSWRLNIYPLIKNGEATLAPELRAWYEFLTDAPGNIQKLYDQILSIWPYYQFMVEHGQAEHFILAVAEFIRHDKVFSLSEAHQLLLAMQTGISTLASEAQEENATESSNLRPRQEFLADLGLKLNLNWFPNMNLIRPGQHSTLLSSQELNRVLDLLRPYRRELVPLFMAIERKSDLRLTLNDDEWEQIFTKEILPNIFTSPENFTAQIAQFIRLAELTPQTTLKTQELGEILAAVEPLFNRTKNRLGQKSYTFKLGDYFYRNLSEEQLLSLIAWMQGQDPGVPARRQFWAALEMSIINTALMDNPRYPQRDVFLNRLMDIAESTARPLASRLESLWHIFYLHRKKSDLKGTTIEMDRVVRRAIKFLQDPETVETFLQDIEQNHTMTLYEFTSLLTPAMIQFVQEKGKTSVGTIITKILNHCEADNSLLPGPFKDAEVHRGDRSLLSMETIASIFFVSHFNLNNLVGLVEFSLNKDVLAHTPSKKVTRSDLFTLALMRKFMPILRNKADRDRLARTIEPLVAHENPVMRLYAQSASWANPSYLIDPANFTDTIKYFLEKVYLPTDTDLRFRVKLLPLHDLFIMRQDFRQHAEFILRKVLKIYVAPQPRFNQRTLARLGGALGAALFQDITNTVNARTSSFQEIKKDILANLKQNLARSDLSDERRILIQSLIYGFTHNRFLAPEEDKILDEHLSSRNPAVFFHAVKEVIQHKKTNLYPAVVKLLEQTDFLAGLLDYPTWPTGTSPNPTTIQNTKRVFYLLSLLNQIVKTGNLSNQLALFGINTLLRDKLAAYPLRKDLTLDDLSLENIQLDFLFAELPPKDQFPAILNQRLAQDDFANAHELLAMLTITDLRQVDPNLRRTKLIPLITAYFEQLRTKYRDLFINGPQDYRPFLKIPILTGTLNNYKVEEQVRFLLDCAEHAKKLLYQDPAQPYLSFLFYNLIASFMGAHQFAVPEYVRFQEEFKTLASYFINFPETLAAWPAGQVLRIYFLGHYDYQLLGFTTKRWKKWQDFFKKEGRQLLYRAQDSKVTPENEEWLRIADAAPVNHLQGGLIPPIRPVLPPNYSTPLPSLPAAGNATAMANSLADQCATNFLP